MPTPSSRTPVPTQLQRGGSLRETTPRTDIQFTTTAQGVGESVQIGGQIDSTNTIFGAEPKLTVMARDPHTGRVIRVENVKIQLSAGTTVSGIDAGGLYTLQCDNYDAFQRRDVSRMLLIPAPQVPVIQNNALPQPVRVSDTIGAFGNTPSPVCRAFNAAEQQASQALGMLQSRSDLNVFQGRRDGRSPGIAVNQTTGHVTIFDNSGQQHLTMDGRQVTIQAGSINTGQALEGRSYFGFPAVKNPVNDYVPQGTIVAPQPRLIPNIAEMLNLVMTVVDIVDLIRICSDIVKVMSTDMTKDERNAALTELAEEGQQSRWERDIAEAQVATDREDRLTGTTQGARGITEVR